MYEYASGSLTDDATVRLARGVAYAAATCTTTNRMAVEARLLAT